MSESPPDPQSPPAVTADHPDAPRQVIVQAPELPPAPRSPAGLPSRRATFDPRVRFWFILAALILIVTTYLGVKQVSAWSYDRSLVVSGTAVNATVVEIAGMGQTNRRANFAEPIKLKFALPGGAEQTVSGWLREQPQTGNMVNVGQQLPIRYDPNRPTRWTDRRIPPSIGPALISVYLLVPVAGAVVAAGIWQRSRILATWRTGKLTPAAVLSVSTTPIAPGYSHLKVAPTGTRDGTYSVYVPRSLGNPMRGDVVWIIHRDAGGPAVAAKAFL